MNLIILLAFVQVFNMQHSLLEGKCINTEPTDNNPPSPTTVLPTLPIEPTPFYEFPISTNPRTIIPTTMQTEAAATETTTRIILTSN